MLERILGGIYISSIEPINEGVDFKQSYGITHVISVVPGHLPEYIQNYQHLQIEVTDESTSNILEDLPKAMDFIDSALFPNGQAEDSKKHQGAVLVHCAQGQSRSVTVVVAYLMYKYNLSLKQAVHAVKRKCPDACPNEGFMEQLGLFKDMDFKVDPNSEAYRAFLAANSLKLDPSGGQLRELGLWPKSSDSKESDSPKEDLNLRCKRCRMVLATSDEIETHEVPGADSRQSQFIKTAPNSRRVISAAAGSKICSHYFMGEPVEWMKPELEKQDMEGKFSCPKCESKVGGYSWKGSRCSCGKWMIPALHLQTAKVDAMKRH